MASSLLALLDDITSILDDVATMTKVATRKTAGVLGDDLALNAQQVTGVNPDRELPVVWAVAKGSLVNKAILVPVALLLSAFLPWAITPLMVVGGLFLCFEGAEKLVHKVTHRRAASPEDVGTATERAAATAPEPAAPTDPLVTERDKIKGAIRTDFVLSAEIIVITLGSVARVSFMTQVVVLIGIALIMTVGVYGLVAGIVKLDDGGLALMRSRSAVARGLGSAILRTTPWLMKFLSIAGTAAMFLVGGGILTHAIPPLHHVLEPITAAAGHLGAAGFNAAVGLAAGLVVVAIVSLAGRIRGKH